MFIAFISVIHVVFSCFHEMVKGLNYYAFCVGGSEYDCGGSLGKDDNFKRSSVIRYYEDKSPPIIMSFKLFTFCNRMFGKLLKVEIMTEFVICPEMSYFCDGIWFSAYLCEDKIIVIVLEVTHICSFIIHCCAIIQSITRSSTTAC